MKNMDSSNGVRNKNSKVYYKAGNITLLLEEFFAYE